MSADTGSSEPPSRVSIGMSFGNTNSSIAYTTASEGKAEVIANEMAVVSVDWFIKAVETKLSLSSCEGF